jgi:hypothetical protein
MQRPADHVADFSAMQRALRKASGRARRLAVCPDCGRFARVADLHDYGVCDDCHSRALGNGADAP